MLTGVLSIFPSHLHKTKATKVHGMKGLSVLALLKDLCMNRQTDEMATKNKKMGWHCKNRPANQWHKGKLGDSWKKKLEILQKVHEILFFPYRDLGRGGNKYLLKYYLVLCLVQFYLLPSPLGNPGTSPALQAREWGIVWSSPVLGGRGVGQIKKKSSLWFCKVPVISRVVYTMAVDFKTTYF